ncbi:DNA replication/repair protein RecF [Brucella pseudogrignonensis]|uniref:DNA replication/repair protein RecF n=1 Tax=Brucella pseudogrignonensis TaxID=419475 RepID=UPI000CFCF614|nr:DNA replication/repair protein RecF [Brucella pseudogrignonensis]MQP39860.1 DNA replication/repair protein RecF [Ochrobactrum sp. MYb237]PQZ42405.1 DNA replication/repair protein RecF [Brucella pseudogrignonensis]PRA41835.1 DNA replication/repair protein RecF [Brucella pseudogrignonensis]PRA70739.1 DNA replication/repair protein RecF [Brucella pseudogrignonensis]
MSISEPIISRPDRVSVRRLKLSDFRNYTELTLPLGPGHVVLTGENGSGKTNLIEAVSFLSPGRGLRRASYDDVARTSGHDGFAIHASLDCMIYGDAEIGTGTAGGGEGGRKVRINSNAASGDELLDYARILWVVPSMDGLFTGGASDRRRFLDRMVLAIDTSHGKRVLDYEKAMRSRNRLLSDGNSDNQWFDAIESQMAELGIAIAAARSEAMRLIAAMIERLPAEGPFPKADCFLEGTLEQRIGLEAALDLEEDFRRTMRDGRARDRAAGRTLEGPHRTDLIVQHRPKSMPAALCSTGEQKALLIGLILAHARLTGELSGMAPILLLDEIAAHLDTGRRAALFGILDDLGGQAFMTGTDRSLFEALEGDAQFFNVAAGELTRL